MVIELVDGPLIGTRLSAEAVAVPRIEVAARAVGMPGYREVHEYVVLARAGGGKGEVRPAVWSRLIRFEGVSERSAALEVHAAR